MGLGNALGRVYRLQAFNLLRLVRWLFWAAVFFVVGLLTGAKIFAPAETYARYDSGKYYILAAFALLGFLIKLWEWRLSKPVRGGA